MAANFFNSMVSLQALHSIGVPLADSLAILEARSLVLNRSAISGAVLQTWERLADDAVRGAALLSQEYLSSLHWQLATLAGGEAPGLFLNHGQPLVPDEQQVPWTLFIEEACSDEPMEPAWVLTQLYWGGHVRSLSLSLGWFAMNIVLAASRSQAIVPPILDHARLLQSLDYAGPDLHDAETLRALIGTYAATQWATASG